MVSVMERSSPVLARYRLSAELRKLRERSKLTATQVAKITGETVSTVTRRERSEWRSPDPDTVRALLDVYRHLIDITESKRSFLIGLAVQGNKEGWWDAYRDRYTSDLRDYLGLEHGANLLRSCDPQVITWFFHNADYMRTALRGRYPLAEDIGPEAIEELAQITELRQLLLEGVDALQVHAIIDESALHRPPAGLSTERFHAQLVRLFEAAQKDNVIVQVIPWTAGIYPALHPFGVLEFDNDVIPEAGFIENLFGSKLTTDPGQLGLLNYAWGEMLEKAISPGDTLILLKEMAERPPDVQPW